MEVFDLLLQLILDYSDYITSFINIRDPYIWSFVDEKLNASLLWPDPLFQINPAFEPGYWVDELVAQGILHASPQGRRVNIETQGQIPGYPGLRYVNL